MIRTTLINTPSQMIKLMIWNINGLHKRRLELTQFMRQEKIDIALITDTHLTSRGHAELRGYKLYVCNHPSGGAHGGSAIYIRENLQHYEASSYCTPQIQATCISAVLHCGTKVNVLSVYCPQSTN